MIQYRRQTTNVRFRLSLLSPFLDRILVGVCEHTKLSVAFFCRIAVFSPHQENFGRGRPGADGSNTEICGQRFVALPTNLGLNAGQTQAPPRPVSIRSYFGWGLSYLSRKCHARAAGAWLRDIHQQADQRCFACTIRSDQCVYGMLWNLQRHPIQRYGPSILPG
jgi:hypothetical protein